MTSNEYTVKNTQRNTRPDGSQLLLISPCNPFDYPLHFCVHAFLIPAVDFLLASTRENSPKNYFIKKKERLPFV